MATPLQGGVFKTGADAAASSGSALKSHVLAAARPPLPPPMTRGLKTHLVPRCATTMAPTDPGSSLLLHLNPQR